MYTICRLAVIHPNSRLSSITTVDEIPTEPHLHLQLKVSSTSCTDDVEGLSEGRRWCSMTVVFDQDDNFKVWTVLRMAADLGCIQTRLTFARAWCEIVFVSDSLIWRPFVTHTLKNTIEIDDNGFEILELR